MVTLDPHSQKCLDAMDLFDGTPVNPNDVSGDNLASLQQYLTECGVTHFKARTNTGDYGELVRVRPDKADVARRLGFRHFIPPKAWWPRLALQALLADRLRDAVGSPITVRNAWRPPAYNDAVGGAPESAHVNCAALDLSLASPDAWDSGVKFLLDLYAEPDFCLNLGVGFSRDTRFVHLGCFDDRAGGARRRWRYNERGAPVKWHTKNLPK